MAERLNWTVDTDARVCFVTTGATAPFTALIESMLSPPALNALRKAGYTHLLVQYGTAQDVFTNSSDVARSYLQEDQSLGPLTIGGIDFDQDVLRPQFRLVQQTKGLVISHAGSGTILEALRYQVPLIVVPNTGLLDNHQAELAAAMERSNYLLQADVKDIAPVVAKAGDFRLKMAQFPPITSGKHRETKSFAAIMDETVGFLD